MKNAVAKYLSKIETWILLFAFFLNVVMMVGYALKVSWIPTYELMICVLAMPAVALLAAKTWSRGFKYAFLVSLVLPLNYFILNMLTFVLSLPKAPSIGHAIMSAPLAVASNGALWLLIISLIFPVIGLAIVIKFFALKRVKAN